MSKGVLHFVGLFGNLGGTEKATLEEMLMLRAEGYEVVYTCITPMGRFRELLDAEGFSWKSCDYHGPTDVAAFIRIWNRLKEIHALRVILVAHNVFAMFCLLFQRKKQISFLRHHYHHFGVGTIPRWKWWIIYAVASVSIQNIAFVCHYIRNEALQIWPKLDKRSCVIHNIFRMPPKVSEEEKNNARKSLGIPLEAWVIGGAGRLDPVKRWDVWCEVVGAVIARNPLSFAFVVGSGLDAPHIKTLQALNPNRVLFAGVLADMSLFYKAIDALLFISDFDATPRIPMESMSYGIPVVVSLKRGGLFEILPNGKIFAYSDHDVNLLVEQVLKTETLAPTDAPSELEHLSPEKIRIDYRRWLGLGNWA